MVFSSLLFVFLFFAANIVVQALVPGIRKKNIVMLAFSLVFYAWAGPKYILLLLGMTFICWAGGMYIAYRARTHRQRKAALAITVTLMLLILCIFKYTGFFLQNLQLLTGFPKVIPQIALPIGISFYTFQLLSYVVDVYREDVEPQEKYWLLLLYASLFHQCIAGPIVRYKDVNDDILHRQVKRSEVDRGITRFAVGLAKKAVLANGCAGIADTLLATTPDAMAGIPALGVWLGGLAYMLQIYLDFSAYSDMAIGMGLMCGFHYKENFNYPYVANSITDFWRRWHISLSTFFRDYVYIPLARCQLEFYPLGPVLLRLPRFGEIRPAGCSAPLESGSAARSGPARYLLQLDDFPLYGHVRPGHRPQGPIRPQRQRLQQYDRQPAV